MIQVKMLFGEGETGYLFNLEDKINDFCEKISVSDGMEIINIQCFTAYNAKTSKSSIYAMITYKVEEDDLFKIKISD